MHVFGVAAFLLAWPPKLSYSIGGYFIGLRIARPTRNEDFLVTFLKPYGEKIDGSGPCCGRSAQLVPLCPAAHTCVRGLDRVASDGQLGTQASSRVNIVPLAL